MYKTIINNFIEYLPLQPLLPPFPNNSKNRRFLYLCHLISWMVCDTFYTKPKKNEEEITDREKN